MDAIIKLIINDEMLKIVLSDFIPNGSRETLLNRKSNTLSTEFIKLKLFIGI